MKTTHIAKALAFTLCLLVSSTQSNAILITPCATYVPPTFNSKPKVPCSPKGCLQPTDTLLIQNVLDPATATTTVNCSMTQVNCPAGSANPVETRVHQRTYATRLIIDVRRLNCVKDPSCPTIPCTGGGLYHSRIGVQTTTSNSVLTINPCNPPPPGPGGPGGGGGIPTGGTGSLIF